MNRRGFLKALAAAAAAASVLDPEQLLWVPGKKTFFIPENPRLANLAETADLNHFAGYADYDAKVEAVLHGEEYIASPHRYTVAVSGGRMYSQPREFFFDTNWNMIGLQTPDGKRHQAPSAERQATLNTSLFGTDRTVPVSINGTHGTTRLAENRRVQLTKRTPAGVRTFDVQKY